MGSCLEQERRTTFRAQYVITKKRLWVSFRKSSNHGFQCLEQSFVGMLTWLLEQGIYVEIKEQRDCNEHLSLKHERQKKRYQFWMSFGPTEEKELWIANL